MIFEESLSARRAWIEIGAPTTQADKHAQSLSARRAWIEIVITAMTSQISVVALRKESVDRNLALEMSSQEVFRSLSARRAWIEIRLADMSAAWNRCRSPQGERG